MKKLITLLLLFCFSFSQGQLVISSDIQVAAQKSADGKMYKTQAGKNVPYANAGEFLSTIPDSRRHVGQIAYVYDDGDIFVYQFKGGILDGDFKKVEFEMFFEYPLYAKDGSTAAVYYDSLPSISSKITQSASDPTDIPVGFWSVRRNTTTGKTYLWANIAGSLIKVELL